MTFEPPVNHGGRIFAHIIVLYYVESKQVPLGEVQSLTAVVLVQRLRGVKHTRIQ